MLVVGAKGFAKELLETILQINPDESIVFYDDISGDLPDLLFDKFTIFRDFESAKDYLSTIDQRFVLGIGNPKLRFAFAQKFESMGGELTSLISPFARIGSFQNSIGKGTCILTNSIVETANEIGESNLIHVNCLISHDVKIGNYCEISPAVNLLGAASVGDFCSIGTGAVVLPKISIGNNVIVGAGAVVTENVPDNKIVVGTPAKEMKKTRG